MSLVRGPSKTRRTVTVPPAWDQHGLRSFQLPPGIWSMEHQHDFPLNRRLCRFITALTFKCDRRRTPVFRAATGFVLSFKNRELVILTVLCIFLVFTLGSMHLLFYLLC
jgi:hypothetical protein